MSYRNCLTAVLVISLAAALSAPAGAQTKEPIKLAIGVDAAYVPIYLSKQAKLFEKHGVNVELVQFTQGGDALDYRHPSLTTQLKDGVQQLEIDGSAFGSNTKRRLGNSWHVQAS